MSSFIKSAGTTSRIKIRASVMPFLKFMGSKDVAGKAIPKYTKSVLYPKSPNGGDLWYKVDLGILIIYKSKKWHNVIHKKAGNTLTQSLPYDVPEMIQILGCDYTHADTPHLNAKLGDLWYDTGKGTFNIWLGNVWVSVKNFMGTPAILNEKEPRPKYTQSIAHPKSPNEGDIWYKEGDQTVNIYKNKMWENVIHTKGYVAGHLVYDVKKMAYLLDKHYLYAYTPIPAPVMGDLWYDMSTDKLKLYLNKNWWCVEDFIDYDTAVKLSGHMY